MGEWILVLQLTNKLIPKNKPLTTINSMIEYIKYIKGNEGVLQL
jgi:hypothetical protein